MRHAVEPFVDGAGEVAVARDADLGQRLQTPLQLGEMGVMRRRLTASPAHMQGDDRDQHEENQHREPEQRKQDQHGVERDAPHPESIQSHGAKL